MNDFQREDLPNRGSDEVFTLLCFKNNKKQKKNFFKLLVFVWSSFALNF